MSKMHVKMTVNGRAVEALAEPRTLLIHFLREDLALTGPHIGCETSHCGACTVDMNGRSVKACTVFAVQADGAEITTIEGLADPRSGLHPVQQAFVDHGAIQCGFCTPGMILSTKALLDENPDPTDDEIQEALLGNLCRCTGYVQILEAVRAAAAALRNETGGAS